MEASIVSPPELRFAQSGTAWVSMRVVAKDRRRGASGEWEDGDKVFIDVKAFGRLAENIAETFVETGETVCVEGALKSREWETDDGQKRTAFEVVVDNFGYCAPSTRWKAWKATTAERGETSPANDPWNTQTQGPSEPPW